jgi:hypothetical protein
MAHSEGFEPSTARFVAEYSIQLSYECIFRGNPGNFHPIFEEAHFPVFARLSQFQRAYIQQFQRLF